MAGLGPATPSRRANALATGLQREVARRALSRYATAAAPGLRSLSKPVIFHLKACMVNITNYYYNS